MIQPLDLQTIFVNYFAGSMEIFFFVALLFFSYLAVKLKMGNNLFLICMALFIVMMSQWYDLLYSLLIIMVAMMFYYVLSKMFKD